MIILTPAVLRVLYACVLYFCICTCSAQLSMFHMERHSRNKLTIIITFITIHLCACLSLLHTHTHTHQSAVCSAQDSIQTPLQTQSLNDMFLQQTRQNTNLASPATTSSSSRCLLRSRKDSSSCWFLSCSSSMFLWNKQKNSSGTGVTQQRTTRMPADQWSVERYFASGQTLFSLAKRRGWNKSKIKICYSKYCLHGNITCLL